MGPKPRTPGGRWPRAGRSTSRASGRSSARRRSRCRRAGAAGPANAPELAERELGVASRPTASRRRRRPARSAANAEPDGPSRALPAVGQRQRPARLVTSFAAPALTAGSGRDVLRRRVPESSEPWIRIRPPITAAAAIGTDSQPQSRPGGPSSQLGRRGRSAAEVGQRGQPAAAPSPAASYASHSNGRAQCSQTTRRTACAGIAPGIRTRVSVPQASWAAPTSRTGMPNGGSGKPPLRCGSAACGDLRAALVSELSSIAH